MDGRVRNLIHSTIGLMLVLLGYDLVYTFADISFDDYINVPLSVLYYVTWYSWVTVVAFMGVRAATNKKTISFFISVMGFSFSIVMVELIALLLSGSHNEYRAIKTLPFLDAVKWLCFVVLFVFSYVKNK